MKVALLFWTSADESEYGNVFGIDETEWFLPRASDVKLPVGTDISFTHKPTNGLIHLTVLKHHYFMDMDLFCLQVVTTKDIEPYPAEFKKYIEDNWIFGNQIEEWVNKA